MSPMILHMDYTDSQYYARNIPECMHWGKRWDILWDACNLGTAVIEAERAHGIHYLPITFRSSAVVEVSLSDSLIKI